MNDIENYQLLRDKMKETKSALCSEGGGWHQGWFWVVRWPLHFLATPVHVCEELWQEHHLRVIVFGREKRPLELVECQGTPRPGEIGRNNVFQTRIRLGLLFLSLQAELGHLEASQCVAPQGCDADEVDAGDPVAWEKRTGSETEKQRLWWKKNA